MIESVVIELGNRGENAAYEADGVQEISVESLSEDTILA